MAINTFGGGKAIVDSDSMAIYLAQAPNRRLTPDNGYCVALNTMSCAEQFAEWLVHLSDKSWFDADMTKAFIDAAFYALTSLGNVNLHEWNTPAKWTK